MINEIIHGDCLIESDKIASGSVDLILTDLPYGNMKSSGLEVTQNRKERKHNWDLAIDPKRIYEIANRILRKNGKMVLFSQEPYTTQLISEVNPNVPFSYRAIWEKDNFAVALGANRNMVSYYEDVLIFSKSSEAIPPHDFEGVHPLRSYFKRVINFIGLPKKSIIDAIGQRADHTFRTNSSQYSLCTEQTYNEIIRCFNIGEMDGFIEYRELKRVDIDFKRSKEEEREGYLKAHNEQYPSVFNLWEGGKYKSNILRYKKDYSGYHPTQKPVLLLEDLIKTFSNEGDTVVDLTAGSGSTAVAAINTGRNFVAIEQDAKYVEIARKRISEAIASVDGN